MIEADVRDDLKKVISQWQVIPEKPLEQMMGGIFKALAGHIVELELREGLESQNLYRFSESLECMFHVNR